MLMIQHRINTEQVNYTSQINNMASLSNNQDISTCEVNNTISAENLHPLAFTILWSPLPPITCILPFIGHMGIANSRGIANDFQGPYSVGDMGRMVSFAVLLWLYILIINRSNLV